MAEETPAIAEIIELLSKKWVMRIIWELRSQTLTFRELQEACDGLSPSVLNNRLKLLQEAQLIQKGSTKGYSMTKIGEELLEVYKPLKQWAVSWQATRRCSKT